MLNIPNTGAAACAQAWRDNVTLAKGAEAIKPSYVDAIFTVWGRIMDHPEAKALVLKCEHELPQSPWDSIYKLEAIVKRCSTHSGIVWALASLYDAIKNGLVTAAELAVRQLQGRRLPGGKGILDVLLAKKDVVDVMRKRGLLGQQAEGLHGGQHVADGSSELRAEVP